MDSLVLRFLDAEPMYRKDVDDLPKRCYEGKWIKFKLYIGGIECTFERILRANWDAKNRCAILISRQNFNGETLEILREEGWKELTEKQARWFLREAKKAKKAQGKKKYSYAK